MVYYLLLIIFGVINAFLSLYLYLLIGSLLFHGADELVLLVRPIYIFSTSIPFLYFLFLLVEIPLAVLLTTLILRRLNRFGQKFIVSFFLAIVLFIILQIAALVIPPFFKQAATERENPIESGVKQYDFSKTVLFNNRQSAKNTLSIEGNKIVWIEHTKESPPYPKNIWDVMLFEFDPKTSQGVTTQITHLDNAKHGSPESAGVFDGIVFWTQDANLYAYDPYLKKSGLLVKGVGHIYGKYRGFLIYSHGSDPSIYGIEKSGLFIYSLSTKQQETNLSYLVPRTFSMINKDEYLCYAFTQGLSSEEVSIRRYNILTGEIDLVKAEQENIQPAFGYYFRVLDCNNKYIAYKFEPEVPPSTQGPVELQVYQFDQSKNVLVKQFNSHFGSVQGKFVGDTFYYSYGDSFYYLSDENKILARDLVSGTENVVLTETRLDDWDIDGGYIVYQKSTKEGDSSLYLQSIQR